MHRLTELYANIPISMKKKLPNREVTIMNMQWTYVIHKWHYQVLCSCNTRVILIDSAAHSACYWLLANRALTFPRQHCTFIAACVTFKSRFRFTWGLNCSPILTHALISLFAMFNEQIKSVFGDHYVWISQVTCLTRGERTLNIEAFVFYLGVGEEWIHW